MDQQTTFITLGTAGGPVPKLSRAQPSHAVVRGDHCILVDCGDGAIGQLMRAGIDYRNLNDVFISHHHMDHIAGLYALIGASMMVMRATPLRIYGPKGTARIVSSLVSACEVTCDIGLGLPGKNYPHPNDFLNVRDIEPGESVQVLDVNVSSCENTHYRSEDQFGTEGAVSLSLRVDAPDRVIVFTGDTGPCKTLETFASGADLLVGEMMDVEGTMAMVRKKNPKMPVANIEMMARHMAEHHLVPEQLGRLASRAGASHVVAVHIPLDSITPETAPDYEIQIAKEFFGTISIAEDLQAY